MVCFADAPLFAQPVASQQDGGLAQLGERLDGIQKVRGSSPLSSIFFDVNLAGVVKSEPHPRL